jgi:hypothetical protein
MQVNKKNDQDYSETLVPFYQTERRDVSEVRNGNVPRLDNLRSGGISWLSE